jgi:GNAT superfamily N-acetyltransferase
VPDAALVWREPVRSDAEALGRMHHRSWVDTYTDLLPPDWFAENGPEHWVASWRERLSEPLPPGVRRVAVFAAGDVPVGWSVVGPGRETEGVPPVRERALWGLYVAREHLGTGLGQALLEWAVGDAPAELWTARGNHRAMAFYRRNGFVEDGVEVPHGHTPLVEVRMVRPGP